MLIVPSVTFMTGAYIPELCACATGDVEACNGNITYQLDDYGFAYEIENDGCNKRYLTDFAVTDLAYINGGLYASAGDELIFIDTEKSESKTVFKADNKIDGFAVTEKKMYILANGKIISANLNGSFKKTEVKENVIDFWLEDSNTLSYMVDDEMIYTVNLVTDETESDINYKSDLGEGLIVADGEAVNGRSEVGGSITINSLRNTFPSTKARPIYWNHTGSENSPYSYTYNGCTHHGNCTYTGTCGCNSYSSCIQCMGYAFFCGKLTTDKNPNILEGKWQMSRDSSRVDSVKPGDIIRYRNDSHSIFVTAVSGNTVTFTDCNSNWNCNIRWDATVSKSTIKASFTKIYITPYTAGVETLKINPNEGSVDKGSITVTGEQKIGELPIPTREGYSFVGWFTSPDDDGEEVTAETIYISGGQLKEIYAHWEPNRNKITFDANAYEASTGERDTASVSGMPANQEKVTDRTLTVKTGARPTRHNFTFLSWNTEPDGSGIEKKKDYTLPKDYNDGDITYYAQWKGVEKGVKFNLGGGTMPSECAGITDAKCYYGNQLSTIFIGNTRPTEIGLPEPEREGFEFLGWSLNEKEEFVETSILLVNDNGEPCIRNEAGELVKDPDGKGQEEKILVSKDIFVTEDDFYVEKTYKAVKNWDELRLYARWKEKEYKITYDANANGDKSVSGVLAPQIKKYSTGSVILRTTTDTNGGKKPARKGYNFLGWAKKKDASTPDYLWGRTYEYSSNSDITLYAVWDPEKYDIKFNPNYPGAPAIEEKLVKIYDKDLKIDIAEPEKTGYDFVCWNTKPAGDGTSYKTGDKYTREEPATLYAQWKAKVLTVSFDVNGSDEYVADAKYTYDEKYGKLPEISRQYYTFCGWETADGTKVDADSTVKITENQTFKAIWKGDKLMALFNAGDGNCSVLFGYFNYGETYGSNFENGKLPVATQDGYVFAGWYFNGKEIKSDDLCTLNLTDITSDTITLHAKYVEIPAKKAGKTAVVYIADGVQCGETLYYIEDMSEITPPAVPGKTNYDGKWVKSSETVDYIVYCAEYTGKLFDIYYVIPNMSKWDKDAEKTDTVPVKYGDPIPVKKLPEKAGYTFAGWDKKLPSSMPAEKLTITAKFTPVDYEVTYKDINGVVSKASYNLNYESLSKPGITPKIGYTAEWPEDNLVPGGMVIEAIYTPITYTATFEIDGKQYYTYFTVENEEIPTPDISLPDGYLIEWGDLTPVASDKTVIGVIKRDCTVEIKKYVKEKWVSYFGTIVLSPETKGTIFENTEYVWIVNGTPVKANSKFISVGNDHKLTLAKLKTASTTVKLQLVENGKVVAETKTETVRVNTSFFNIISAFFRYIFGRIKPLYQ